MDSLITAAARALAQGDPLGALNRVALRNDAPALALRGIAMAQLGDFTRAKSLLRKASRTFGPREIVSRARCVVAEAEIALASRELAWPTKALHLARKTLEAHGDKVNASHAQLLETRRLLLIGRLDEAERHFSSLDAEGLSPALEATRQLMAFGIAVRRLRTKEAHAACARAERAARIARIPALILEVQGAAEVLKALVAQSFVRGETRVLRLDEVETLFASSTLVVDACRLVVRDRNAVISLSRRPVIFALARTLAEAWPQDVPRSALIARVFRMKQADESHRVRLRVEIGRLRAAIKELADVRATREGFMLEPSTASEVAVLAPPLEGEHAQVLALLADGESWSSSALALALGESQRNVQRALDEMAEKGAVQALGRGRARRWITPPLPGFATTLLLPAMLAGD